KAGGQFAFVAFLTEQIARGLIDPRVVAALPAEHPNSVASDSDGVPATSRLYENYLRDLQSLLTGGTQSTKHWDYVRRILVVLAADEEAHACEAFLVKEALPSHPYRGMSVAEIAQRLGEAGVSYRLVAAIYSFQTLLAAWRQEGGKTPRYGLGLKDLLATLRDL